MSTTPDLTGRQIGKYEIRAFIAAGGMAAVYKGVQGRNGREVAIKVLPSALAEDPYYVARFEREAKTSASLDHPHIVPVYDFGTQDDLSYVVMELLTGGTLTERIKLRHNHSQALPAPVEVARLLRQVGGALDYAHRKGVIHRDIKPSNIMFDANGTPYLVDFGIAKLLTTAAESLTETGVPMGTPIYMAPELWNGDTPTPSVDQYAMAVVVYRLLTGEAPFRADTPYGLMQKHRDLEVPSITTLPTDVADRAHAVISKAMAKNASDRYSSLLAFADAFERAVYDFDGKGTDFFTFALPKRRWLEDGTRLSPSEAPSRALSNTPTKPARRRPLALIGLVVIALAVVAAVLLLGNDAGESNDAAANTDTILGRLETEAPTEAATQNSTEDESPTTTDPTESDLAPAATEAITTPIDIAQAAPGVDLQLSYSDDTLVIQNTSGYTLDIRGLSLQIGDDGPRFDGYWFGEQTSSRFRPGYCIVVGLTSTDPSLPSACDSNSKQPLLYNFGNDADSNTFFVWDNALNVSRQFQVRVNNVSFADCATDAGSCAVAIEDSLIVAPSPTPRPVPPPSEEELGGLLLIYTNGAALTIMNTSLNTLDLSGMQLELPDGSDHFDAVYFGEQTRTRFRPSRCIFLSLQDDSETAPDFCAGISPQYYSRLNQSSYVFVWTLEANPEASFNVTLNDEALATCDVALGRCFVPYPSPANTE